MWSAKFLPSFVRNSSDIVRGALNALVHGGEVANTTSNDDETPQKSAQDVDDSINKLGLESSEDDSERSYELDRAWIALAANFGEDDIPDEY